MKSLRRGLAVGALCGLTMALTSIGYAAGPISGFEAADPTPTPTAGDASNQGTFQGQAPFAGSNQYLITTIRTGDGDGLSPVSGTSAVSNASLGSTLHITGLGTEGSGFLLPFTVAAGDQILSFNYDFLTNELAPGNHNDIAFAFILNGSDVLQGSLQTITTANLAQGQLSLLPDQSGPFQFHTGYQPFSINISSLAPGSYKLGIAVEDRTTSDIPSGLLVDNVQVAAAAVPEPSTIGLTIAGSVLLVAVRRRLKLS